MQELPKPKSDKETLLFIIILCFVSGFLLAVVSYSLRGAQANAKEFDQSKQMLIAAKILSHRGALSGSSSKATDSEIQQVASLRIRPLLTNNQGEVYTLEEKGIDLDTYLLENKKTGYAAAKDKLFYAILPKEALGDTVSSADVAKDLHKAESFVIPISGFGLWGPIYGFLAIGSDGDQVIGTTWYEHAETPGLGANITEEWWQKQFYGKEIFQPAASGTTDFQTAPLGIIVVKGKVKDVYGNAPKSKSAVDGMSGATLTGDGVTAAYRASLTPYRALLLKIHEKGASSDKPSA